MPVNLSKMKNQLSLNQLGLLLLVLILSVSSCRTDKKDGTTTDTTLAPVNNTIIIGQREEADVLNPIISKRSVSRTIYRHFFSRLAAPDPVTLEYQPQLAKSLPTIEAITEGEYAGGYKYTYELREEAKWDNGTPVLASDVVFTTKVFLNPKVGTNWTAAMLFIGDIEMDANNPKKFMVYTRECNISSEENLNTIYIYPEYLYDPEGLLKGIEIAELSNPEKLKKLEAENENLQKFADQFRDPKYSRDPKYVSASGPYRLVEWAANEKVVIEKKKNWWGNALAEKESIFTANLDKITYKTIPDYQTAITLLKNGEIELFSEIPTELFHELQNNKTAQENLHLITPKSTAYFYYAMNVLNPKLSDVKVRKALAHLIDIDGYLERTSFGLSERVSGPFLSSKPYYDKSIGLIPFDVKKAAQLLDEAAWKDTNNNGIRDKKIDGELVELEIGVLMGKSSVAGKEMTEMMRAAAKKIGVIIEIQQQDGPTQSKRRRNGDFDIYIAGTRTAGALDDPYARFHSEAIPPNGNNYIRFGNEKTDAIIEAIRSNCTDEVERNKQYIAFQQEFAKEQPYIMLFTKLNTIAVNKRFDNVKGSAWRPGFFENYFVAK